MIKRFITTFITLALIVAAMVLIYSCPEAETDPVREQIKSESMIQGGFGGF